VGRGEGHEASSAGFARPRRDPPGNCGASAFKSFSGAALPTVGPTEDQEDSVVTAIMLNRQGDSFARYSAPARSVATPFGATSFGGALGRAAWSASASYQEQVDFALAWARWEPALVAQHHREWLSC
jgi:hypothetical protein